MCRRSMSTGTAGRFAYDLYPAPPQGQHVGLLGHRERVVRVDVRDHGHRTCLGPRVGPPRGHGPQLLRRFAGDPVSGAGVDRHRVGRGSTALGHRSRHPCRLG